MTGHLFGAAGAVGAIAAIRSVYEGVVPATRNLESPDPEAGLDLIAGLPRQMPVPATLANAFGFGGHNAALLFTAA